MKSNSSTPVITIVGLGRMGANMARRLARGAVTVHGFDPSAEAREALASESGVQLHATLAASVSAQTGQRLVWLMLPAGAITEKPITSTRRPWLCTGKRAGSISSTAACPAASGGLPRAIA